MRSSKRFWTDLFLLAYLSIQLLLPLRGYLLDKHETRGDFTWNMYSQDYRCDVGYFLSSANGEVTEIELSDFLHRPSRAGLVYHRDRLPSVHAFFCEQLVPDRGQTIRGYVSCSLNDGPWVDLVDSEADLCRASHYGVTQP